MMRAAVVVAILAAGVASSAAQPQRSGDRERLRRGPALIEELKLTDQQEAQWKDLRFAREKKQAEVRASVDVARIELRELLSADKLDRTAIEKKTREITDIQHRMKLDQIDHMFAVLNILTPEQQDIWKEHMAQPRPGLRYRDRPMMRGPRGGGWDGGMYGELDPPPAPDGPPPFPDED